MYLRNVWIWHEYSGRYVLMAMEFLNQNVTRLTFCFLSLILLGVLRMKLSVIKWDESLWFQVHRIDFDDENNVINKTTFVHSDGELWQISASTMNHNVIATVYNHSMFSDQCINHESQISLQLSTITVCCQISASTMSHKYHCNCLQSQYVLSSVHQPWVTMSLQQSTITVCSQISASTMNHNVIATVYNHSMFSDQCVNHESQCHCNSLQSQYVLRSVHQPWITMSLQQSTITVCSQISASTMSHIVIATVYNHSTFSRTSCCYN